MPAAQKQVAKRLTYINQRRNEIKTLTKGKVVENSQGGEEQHAEVMPILEQAILRIDTQL